MACLGSKSLEMETWLNEIQIDGVGCASFLHCTRLTPLILSSYIRRVQQYQALSLRSRVERRVKRRPGDARGAAGVVGRTCFAASKHLPRVGHSWTGSDELNSMCLALKLDHLQLDMETQGMAHPFTRSARCSPAAKWDGWLTWINQGNPVSIL